MTPDQGRVAGERPREETPAPEIPTTMTAWAVGTPGPIEGDPLVSVARPVPRAGRHEVLVKVSACGVCRTDLHLCEGDLAPRRRGVVPGHQVVGLVAAAGAEVTGLAVGQRVGIAWLRSTCGECRWCRAGAENLCPSSLYTGWDADGGFAEYATVPAGFAYPSPTASPTCTWRPCCARGSSATGHCAVPTFPRGDGWASTASARARTSPPRSPSPREPRSTS